MKVLMTADPVGGVWSYALSLAAGLERFGVEVHLAVMGGPVTPDQRAELRSRRNVTLHDSAWRLEWMREPWTDVAEAGAWLLRLERELEPDVIHVNGYAHAALPWRAPVLVVAHSCVLSWWRAVHGCDAPAAWDRYRQAVGAGVRAAAAVVAPTRAMLQEVEVHYGGVAHGRVIPNGADAPAFPLGVRDAFGRYPRPDAVRGQVVLGAGRVWDESKQMQTLAAAAPHMRWPVRIAGSCEHPDGGRRVLEGVDLLGVVPAAGMRQQFRQASILAHPAVYEPFGLVPLEAALAGCALVLADIPSLREVWSDAAVYVPTRDAAALAAAVNRLIEDPHALASYCSAAATRARTLSVRRMTRSYLALYFELGQRTRRGPQEVTACV